MQRASERAGFLGPERSFPPWSCRNLEEVRDFICFCWLACVNNAHKSLLATPHSPLPVHWRRASGRHFAAPTSPIDIGFIGSS